MHKRGVLILNHQQDDYNVLSLIEYIKSQSLDAYILSTRPTTASKHYSSHLKQQASIYLSTDSNYLDRGDIHAVLKTLHHYNFEVIACISTFTPYRTLMAETNAIIGAPDLPIFALKQFLNKDKTRNLLYKAGLTSLFIENEDFDMEWNFAIAAYNAKIKIFDIYKELKIHRDSTISLEKICSEPSTKITKHEMQHGVKYIKKCLHVLNFTQGFLLIKCRFDKTSNRWDIATIKPFADALTADDRLLKLWIKTLLIKNDDFYQEFGYVSASP